MVRHYGNVEKRNENMGVTERVRGIVRGMREE
jgi:hypothetical protein